MDIAIRLALAIAERTWQVWQENRGHNRDMYIAYPLCGGSELWNVTLKEHTRNSQISVQRDNGEALQLNFNGSPSKVRATVNLVPSGAKRLSRAKSNICSSFELPLSRPATLVASGIVTFALSVLAGSAPVESSSLDLPTNSSRSMQCTVQTKSVDKLLADVSQPARHRVFIRARDVGSMNGLNGGSAGHTNTIKDGYSDNGTRGEDIAGHSNNSYAISHQNTTDGDGGHVNNPPGGHVDCTATGHVNVAPYHMNNSGIPGDQGHVFPHSNSTEAGENGKIHVNSTIPVH